MHAGTEQGFSLIEVLAAVAILALVAMPLLGTFTAATQSGHSAKLQTIATFHAQQLMEEARAGQLAPGSGTLPYGAISGFFAFTLVAEADATSLRRITITVTWNEARGPRSYRVVTLVE